MVHLCPRISDDMNVLGQEFVAELGHTCQWITGGCSVEIAHTRPKSAGNYKLVSTSRVITTYGRGTHGLLLRQITGCA